MKEKYCWYTSYGSNMLIERFYSYILGGKSSITGTFYPGCRNKTLPLENRGCFLNHLLYFSRNSKTWENGGVAFIDTNDNLYKTPARSYLITQEQFTDILCQENGKDSRDFDLDINLDEITEKGIVTLDNFSWYNTILFTGIEQRNPSFTFTNSSKKINDFTQPGELYLTTIIRGLIETFDFNDREIILHLKKAAGIKNKETETRLPGIIKKARLIK